MVLSIEYTFDNGKRIACYLLQYFDVNQVTLVCDNHALDYKFLNVLVTFKILHKSFSLKSVFCLTGKTCSTYLRPRRVTTKEQVR